MSFLFIGLSSWIIALLFMPSIRSHWQLLDVVHAIIAIPQE